MYHHWKYISHRRWVCEHCEGKTDNPNKGDAQKPICPGKPNKRRK